mmetsp:Transcript_36398/g.58945  ORF Transcript_36398/g.58945 Transcript_36398/m.58945 type:complete len:174 (+) Transcript_36398:304-825(+)
MKLHPSKSSQEKESLLDKKREIYKPKRCSSRSSSSNSSSSSRDHLLKRRPPSVNRRSRSRTEQRAVPFDGGVCSMCNAPIRSSSGSSTTTTKDRCRQCGSSFTLCPPKFPRHRVRGTSASTAFVNKQTNDSARNTTSSWSRRRKNLGKAVSKKSEISPRGNETKSNSRSNRRA